METQPARINYFFDKGYRDLTGTIKMAFSENSKWAAIFWGKTSAYWSDSNDFLKIPAIATAFASLSVVVFGSLFTGGISILHVVFLSAVFSTVYLCFMTIWISDKMFRMVRGVFTACPFCHYKTDIPVYHCPQCKIAHTRLIPSKYGVLSRDCQCGTSIPTTFFNGRRNLDASCPDPKCKRNLKSGENTPICIPIVGGPSVGKTCFLFASIRELKTNYAPSRKWGFRFLDNVNEDNYKLFEKRFTAGTVPHKTVEMLPVALNFFLTHEQWNPDKLVYFYDAAGEAFMDTTILSQHRFYDYLHGIVFLIDPFSIPGLMIEYQDDLKQSQADIRPSDMMLDDAFDAMIINLEQNFNNAVNDKINKPIAIVINKVDAFDLEQRIGEKAAKEKMLQDQSVKSVDEAIHLLCKEMLMQYQLSNFLRRIEEKFSDHQFFSVSSLGNMEGQQRQTFNPIRTGSPIAWLLGKADKHLKN